MLEYTKYISYELEKLVNSILIRNSAPNYSFTKNLSFGDIDEEVRILQRLLNSQGFVLAESGPGSPGNETNIFADRAETAIKKFQAHYGIVSSGTPKSTGYGLVGPRTRSKLNELASGV